MTPEEFTTDFISCSRDVTINVGRGEGITSRKIVCGAEGRDGLMELSEVGFGNPSAIRMRSRNALTEYIWKDGVTCKLSDPFHSGKLLLQCPPMSR